MMLGTSIMAADWGLPAEVSVQSSFSRNYPGDTNLADYRQHEIVVKS